MNIIVMFGGKSLEHDISIITAIGLVKKASKDNNVIPVYLDKNNKMYTGECLLNMNFYANNYNAKKLKEVVILPGQNTLCILNKNKIKEYCRIDFAFLCMHGSILEGGALAGIMELNNIPYSSSGIGVSSIMQDKYYTKLVCQALNIRTIDYVETTVDTVIDSEFVNNVIAKLGYETITKPRHSGSSIGIGVAKNQEELYNTILNSLSFEKELIIEKYIKNIAEINISALKIDNDIVISNWEQPIKMESILSFDNKYIDGEKIGMEYMQKEDLANLSTTNQNYIIKTAKKLYQKLGMFGVVRFDFIIDQDTSKVYLNEINGIPGSFANYLYKDYFDYETMQKTIIKQGQLRKRYQDKYITSFESSVLHSSRGFKK